MRSTVFGPVVDARTERLSAKLQELAAQPLKIEPTKDAAEESTKVEPEAEDESDSKRTIPTPPGPFSRYSFILGFEANFEHRNGH